MITREDAARIREQLHRLLDEDAHNSQRLVSRLDALTRETGIGAHAAMLMILTRLSFEEEEARAHWNKILDHRESMSTALCRDTGIRVAVLDYFMNVNRQLTQPTLIELELAENPERSRDSDPTTGLADSHAFRVSVQTELRRAKRYEQPASIVLCDLDNFADLNKTLGTLVCDRLLKELTILLVNNTRDIDIAARPGEDEFAILLPATDRNGALLVAERFRREVEHHFARREGPRGPVNLTLSAGVATYPNDALSPEELLANAAQALYQAKALGKNSIQAFLPERRRFLRFDLEPGRFEVEVLGSGMAVEATALNLSRNGLLFTSPAPLEVGEQIELRVAELKEGERPLRVRGSVVRLELLPEPVSPASPQSPRTLADPYEVGVAFDLDWRDGAEDLLEFLERAQRHESPA